MKKSKQLAQEIRHRIEVKRGELGRKRKKKFARLKNTGELKNYYLAKRKVVEIVLPKPIIKKEGFISKVVSWFKKIFKLK